jgi:hypothetical protein
MTKTLNQIIIFFLHQNQIFFQQHWESEYFFRKKTITPHPFKLNGRSLTNSGCTETYRWEFQQKKKVATVKFSKR